eukprot:scaffold268809_cov44-Prasinocladus_malaysianus.AAC.1
MLRQQAPARQVGLILFTALLLRAGHAQVCSGFGHMHNGACHCVEGYAATTDTPSDCVPISSPVAVGNWLSVVYGADETPEQHIWHLLDKSYEEGLGVDEMQLIGLPSMPGDEDEHGHHEEGEGGHQDHHEEENAGEHPHHAEEGHDEELHHDEEGGDMHDHHDEEGHDEHDIHHEEEEVAANSPTRRLHAE